MRRTGRKRTNNKRRNPKMTRRTYKPSKYIYKMKPAPKSKSTTKSKSRAKSEVDKYAESKVSKFQGHLITDVPLGDAYHRGSVASQKHFYYNYAVVYNFKRFFNKIMKKLPKKIVYFPKMPVIKQWNEKFDVNVLRLDLEEIKKYKLKRNLSKLGSTTAVIMLPLMNRFGGITREIKHGMKQKYRYICLYISLILETGGGHANMFLYDTKNKVVELFEPHGGRDKTKNDAHYKDVNHIIKKYNEYMFPKYKFIEPKAYMPKVLQRNIDNFRGSCLSICMMYLHYKILNPNIPSKVIVNRIKHNGRVFLNRYMKYIENTIKNKQTKHKSKSIKTF
tara:strand:- start:91 stop:1092 length:1002 start_codon:yes stop_codon:yes gene_type:complete